MDKIKENQTNRFLKQLGLRLLKASSSSSPYDRDNFLEIEPEMSAVIVDVGAKIGHSSIWFAQHFPTATVYAFESAPSTFERLKRNTARYTSIQSYRFALGSQRQQLRLSTSEKAGYQFVKIATPGNRNLLTDHPIDTISITTLDDFCAQHSIDTIDILKMDAAGYEIEALKGAKHLLQKSKIKSILLEASILSDDTPYISVSELKELLAGYGFRLFSRYDLHHTDNSGRLFYFNAVFKKQ